MEAHVATRHKPQVARAIEEAVRPGGVSRSNHSSTKRWRTARSAPMSIPKPLLFFIRTMGLGLLLQRAAGTKAPDPAGWDRLVQPRRGQPRDVTTPTDHHRPPEEIDDRHRDAGDRQRRRRRRDDPLRHGQHPEGVPLGLRAVAPATRHALQQGDGVAVVERHRPRLVGRRGPGAADRLGVAHDGPGRTFTKSRDRRSRRGASASSRRWASSRSRLRSASSCTASRAPC